MTDTYKGESVGKKIARDTFWRMVVDHQARSRSRDSLQYIVLASREGGDVSVLQSLGVPSRNIMAVDRESSALNEFKRRWPDASTYHGDVSDALRKFGRAAHGALLDFCSELTQDVLDATLIAKDMLPLNAAIGVAFMRGREKKSRKRARVWGNRQMRRLRHAMASHSLERAAVNAIAGKFDAPSLIRETKKFASTIGDASRAEALWAAVWSTYSENQICPNVVLNYHSRTEDSAGVPMTIALGRVSGWGDKTPRNGLEVCRVSETSEDELRDMVLSGKFDPDPHLRLNIDARTIAAWRAHATRGTYTEASP